ncbi:formylglycine-generating enzyme family protein [Aquirufa nivalisilvae]|uniref:formylglycine-generating enzyme family protein n=1 Tax=Aquirufa nivalisilvae TaxID=2516557 RepID=UPI0022A9EC88|nr:SUMF1/EgtB/PvdO family nonheme iron enzyme [Aquirufa nivalisilvae]MCZ2483350.1 formylglycine-generating enzyme family protein [Aquirufa nivalisilvae]
MNRKIRVIVLALSVGICQIGIGQQLKSYRQIIPNSTVAFDMQAIPAGNLVIGSPSTEVGRNTDEGPQQKLSMEAFWMGKTEVTYDEYQLFFEEDRDPAPKPAKEGPDAITRPSPPYIDFTLGMGKVGGFPANSMQHFAALMYCKWLYAKTQIFYRLPTEAEWEYACRAGGKGAYSSLSANEKLEDYAWIASNSGDKYHLVAQKKPNAWGLHDMIGNVHEWVLDHYEPAYSANKKAHQAVFKDKYADAIVRGGSYRDEASMARSASRLAADPVWNRRDPQEPKSKWWNADAPFVGFRIMRPAKQPSPEEVRAFFDQYLKDY